MTRYTLPLLGLLILAPLQAGAAADQTDQTAKPGKASGPAAKSAVKAEAKEAAAAKPKEDAAAKPAAGTNDQTPAAAPVDAATAKTAVATATGYLTALQDKGLGAAPAWLHPAALARFKSLVMPRLKDEQARGTRTLINATFGRDAGYASAAAADPADFLTRFARLISVRDPDAAPRFSALVPIGVLREGEQLHVLIRLTQDGGPEAGERIEVVSLMPHDQDWKVALDGRLQTLADTLGGHTRAAGPRANQPRLEPIPEGLPPAPGEPQGPAGLH